jgi:hypothetical protein
MEKYKKGEISPSLAIFLKQMQESHNEFLTKVVVDTKGKKVNLFSDKLHCSIDCEIGINGSVSYVDSKSGDKKTPICCTSVRHIDMPIYEINDPNSAVLTKTIEPKINLGPCFVCLYITLPGTEEIRGIGFHGSSDDTLGLSPTDGCIRLYNTDLYSIRKLFFKNLEIIIT